MLKLPARLARRVLLTRSIGRPLSAITFAVGMNRLSRMISKYSHYTPKRVQFTVRDQHGSRQTGWMYGVNGHTVDHVAQVVWMLGVSGYEAPLVDLYSVAVRMTQGAIFEVGANSGLYPIIAALIAAPARIHAFEPFPPAHQTLERNLALNGLSGKMTVVPKAVGAEPGAATMYIPVQRFGDVLETSASLRADFATAHSGTIDVPVITLDDYVRENHLDALSILKVDVEGLESTVLRGAAQTLQSLRPLLFIEVLKWCSQAPELEIIRARHDLRVCLLEKNRIVDRPVLEHCPSGDNQLLYPVEKRDLVAAMAEELKLPFV